MFRREVKLLLLGAGESGKSTFLKQMKIIHGFEFDRPQLEEFRASIYLNVIRGMKVLIDARMKLKIPWSEESNEECAETFLQVADNYCHDPLLFCSIAHLVKKLWAEPSIKKAFARRTEFQLTDSVRYYFENLDDLANIDYLPSTQDILHCRKSTRAITEYRVMINKVPFRFVDVGGQRSQRQKWFQCFSCVTSIIFLVSSSEYDQVLLEDCRTNRIDESLVIFETIVNHKAFAEVSFILFLNKTDLLKEKLQLIEAAMQEYESGSSRGNSPQDMAVAACVSQPQPQPQPELKSSSFSNTSDNSQSHQSQSISSDSQTHPHSHHSLVPSSSTSQTHTHSRRHRRLRRRKQSLELRTYADYFPDFDGNPFATEEVQNHMYRMFKSKMYDNKRPIYHHFTTAIDTENITHVFEDVRTTILEKSLTDLMLH